MPLFYLIYLSFSSVFAIFQPPITAPPRSKRTIDNAGGLEAAAWSVFVNEKVEQKGSKKLSTISTKEYKDTGQPEFFRRAQMHNIWSPFSAV